MLGRPCLLMDRDEMSNLYSGPSIDASYQVSVHLAEGFQRRRLKCEKLTDDRRRTTDAKWWQKLTLPLARWAKNNMSSHFKITSILAVKTIIRKYTTNTCTKCTSITNIKIVHPININQGPVLLKMVIVQQKSSLDII